MPRIVDSKNRMDTDIRVRLSYALRSDVKALAKSKKTSVAELVRQLLEAEINKAK